MKSRIRIFEYPQIFIRLLPFTKSKDYIRRRLNEILSPEPVKDCLIDDCLVEKTNEDVSIKIQQRTFIKSNEDFSSLADLVNTICENKSLRPCGLVTLIRLFLDKEIISRIPNNSEIFFAYTKYGWYKVDLTKGMITYSEELIPSSAYIIMESDPI